MRWDKFIRKIQSHCANMTFADKSSYGRIFQQVTHNKIFQNAQDLSVSVGNTYSEYQPMHTFLDNFHQERRYSYQIASHQVEFRR